MVLQKSGSRRQQNDKICYNRAMSEKSLTGNHALSLLYEFTRDLAVAGEMDAILLTIITHSGRTFGRPVAILLPDEDDAPLVAAATVQASCRGRTSGGLQVGCCARTGRLRRMATSGSAATCGCGAACGYRCARRRGVVGVLGLAIAGGDGRAGDKRQVEGEQTAGSERPAAYPRLTVGRQRLLEVFAGTAALAIERAQLAEHAQQIQVLQATERLQRALLHSVSHDLRTPLVAITVAFSNLELADERLDEATRRALARTGRQEAERLNRLVGNLLDISRIEAGALKLALEPCDVEEAIGAALDRLAPERDERPASMATVDERPVGVEMPRDLAPVPMDLALMVQALVNVLDNAVKYSPDGSQIDISVHEADELVLIQVADRGPGIPPGETDHIFERFYRVERPDATHGTGLGLAISKGIVEAHGGRIWAEARPGGGMIVTIGLPLQPAPTQSLPATRRAGGPSGGQAEGAEAEHDG